MSGRVHPGQKARVVTDSAMARSMAVKRIPLLEFTPEDAETEGSGGPARSSDPLDDPEDRRWDATTSDETRRAGG